MLSNLVLLVLNRKVLNFVAEEELDTWNKFLLNVYEMYSRLCFMNRIIYFFILFFLRECCFVGFKYAPSSHLQ